MIFALLPVKDPRKAKQRLSAVLNPLQREVLARTMFEVMLGKLCATRKIDRVAVATSDGQVAAHARRSGVLVFEEQRQAGHSHSADAAARRAAELGAATVLLVPIDVPLATVDEIDGLATEAAHGVIVVPSRDGTGTNALVRTPPDAIPCRFGPGSFRKHLLEARRRRCPVEVRRPPGLLFDVDTPDDVRELLARAPENRVASFLRNAWTSASQA